MRNRLLIGFAASSLVLVLVGYVMAGLAPYDGLVAGVSALVINLPSEPTNWLIELGRWLGIAFAADALYQIVVPALRQATEHARMSKTAARDDAVAIHGQGVYAQALAESLGERALLTEDPVSFEAPCQVVMGDSDEETLSYLAAHATELAGARELHASLSHASDTFPVGARTYLFGMRDIMAARYWAEHPVTSRERIAIIGGDDDAGALLTQGLLVNIFDVAGGVTYRVWGEGRMAEYRHTHPYLDEAVACDFDKLAFRDGAWHDDIDLVCSSTRVILCGTADENLRIAEELGGCNYRGALHLRQDTGLRMGEADDLVVFGTVGQLCNEETIIQEHDHNAGKICDIAYRLGTSGCDGCTDQPDFPADRIGDIERTVADEAEQAREKDGLKRDRLAAVDFERCLRCPRFLATWEGYDTFTRQSNYAVAAHDAQKRRLLEDCAQRYGMAPDEVFDQLSEQDRDRLQEVEHIRWCRFHFLNGWHAGEGKDPATRTHHYLVPYAQLERTVKDYDGDAYRTLYFRTK